MEAAVILTRQALRDLQQIRDAIGQDRPDVAITFCENLLDRAESLAAFPERGVLLRERPGARFVVVKPYLIIYRWDEARSVVRVLRFWHGARSRVSLGAAESPPDE